MAARIHRSVCAGMNFTEPYLPTYVRVDFLYIWECEGWGEGWKGGEWRREGRGKELHVCGMELHVLQKNRFTEERYRSHAFDFVLPIGILLPKEDQDISIPYNAYSGLGAKIGKSTFIRSTGA